MALVFEKDVAIKELEKLIKLIKEDKVSGLSSSSVRKYFPELNSPVVLEGVVKPKLQSIEMTLYIGFK